MRYIIGVTYVKLLRNDSFRVGVMSFTTSGDDLPSTSNSNDYESASDGSDLDGYVTPNEEFDPEEPEDMDEEKVKVGKVYSLFQR